MLTCPCIHSIVVHAAVAGAISRTCTAPVDRLKMLLQIQDGAQALTLRGGMQKMAAEGAFQLAVTAKQCETILVSPSPPFHPHTFVHMTGYKACVAVRSQLV